ncbi:hypothetical protein GT755_14310 [Herbidospora sp. NEAU-GS84]|uniref:Uncharacterized protein n=1 Tax=Herbidospora solisilvae TaxID=2696284 RepID=A0A7C9JUA3_9ACTN|nr:hypothetical protein [Herbidospora solisilvae]NAS22859.1 hypothetical protein [Herbidospora solisilvae]
MAAGTGLAALAAPLMTPAPARAAQHLWRWCFQCSGLWFSGNGGNGYCPLGTGLFGWDHPHQSSGSGDYLLRFADEPGAGQITWRWCRFCSGLWSTGRPDNTRCPAGGLADGGHDFWGSGQYKLEALPNMTNGHGGQAQWFMCRKCAGLFFAGNGPQGVCPAGGAHEHQAGIGFEHVLRQV